MKFGVAIAVSILLINVAYSQDTVTIIDRVPKLAFWPCSGCHKGNFKGKGDPENNHQLVFKHMEEVHECFFCHSSKNPERLHLQDGTIITFNETYLLCSLCHGEVYREWKSGIHGLQTGFWKGPKVRRSCPECHNPHSPKFQPMEAVPNPVDSPSKSDKGGH